MIKGKVIGIGQGGNKAVIKMVEKGIVSNEDYILINSTDRDLPNTYKSKAIIFGGEISGCGKEREMAAQLIEDELNDSSSTISKKLDDFFKTDETMIAICISSTEGGTGSGASPKIAKAIKDNYGIPTHIYGLWGFEDDPKGIENTVGWCKDLDSDFIIHMIDNKKFLKEANNSKEKAEDMANDCVANQINIMLGNTIVESTTKNLDTTDLYKIISNPGYMIVEEANIGSIESVDDFNSLLRKMVNNCKQVNTKAKCLTMGIIFNAKPKTMQNVDETVKVATDAFGTPYESFFHYEDIGGDETVQFIVSAMDRPTEEIGKLIARYNDRTEAVNFDENDGFDDALNNFKTRNVRNTSGTIKAEEKRTTRNMMARFGKKKKPISTETVNIGEDL